jgi:DNA replication protein DnaC
MSEQLQHDLIAARLHYMAANLDDFISRATKAKLGPREIVTEIVRLEIQDRHARSTERRLMAAKLGRFKPMTEFDWAWPKKIDRPAVERALALDFMNDDANVILVAPQGLAKTMIARNIAHNAVMAGHTALVTTAAQLTGDLGQQESARAMQSRLRQYLRPDVLVIDELGYLSFDARAADLLFQVVSRRYEEGPIVLTTNLAFQDWPTIFPGSACVAAMIDRVTHHAEIIGIEGDSYRNRESQARKQRQKPMSRKTDSK